jgi:hypothetical protein
MSDAEFDLLDELYFVQSYEHLRETLRWEDGKLLETLNSLYLEGLVKCLSEPDRERFDQVDVFSEGKQLLFLATKKGLMAHNAL